MNNVQINSFIAMKNLNVDTWTGTAGISATSINRVNINHSFSGTVNATRVKKFVAGSIVGGNWTVSGNVHQLEAGSVSNLNFTAVTVGNLRVSDSITSSTLRSSTNIDSIKAGGLTSSNVYAGTDTLTTGIPASTGDFSAQGLIRNVNVNHFANSNIGAQRTDTLSLGGVQTSNNGTPFGVGTQRIKNLSLSVGKKRVHLRNVTSTAQVTNAFSKNNITPQDLRINIVA